MAPETSPEPPPVPKGMVRPLALVPVLVVFLLLVPIIVATYALCVQALAPLQGAIAGWEGPGDGGNAFSRVLNAPGFWVSAGLSYWLGVLSALVSLAVVVLFTAAALDSPFFYRMSALMKPVLAVPHAAAAFGLLFLIAPSGFLLRLVSPEISGFERPPDWLVVNDPLGISLALGLIVKEIPFLFFVTLAALPQVDPRRAMVASGLGYGRIWGWLISVFPQVYRQIRLPVFAVIAFASSNVDVALILGPVSPAPLSVRILHWMNDPDLSMRTLAAAGALVQVVITLGALLTWWLGERAVRALARGVVLGGWRLEGDRFVRLWAMGAMGLAMAVVSTGLVLLAMWSLAGVWRFPEVFPRIWSFRSWQAQGHNLLETGWRGFVIGLSAALVSLALVLASLENEYRRAISLSPLARWTIYVPLLVPQIAFIGGLSVVFLRLNIDGTLWAVVLVHVIFVYPYVYLTLADPWNAFDTRYLDVARSLGKSLDGAFWTVRLPILLGPVLGALALGFAVSFAQYLPTLLIGAGRQPTITTEAIALASGGNRRLIGVYALVQTLLPFVMFALAALVPRILWADRRALQVSGQGRRP